MWDIREGWQGAAEYVAEGPELYDLWQDPQERYNIFMNNWTEKTWMIGPIGQKAVALLSTYQEFPNRPIQTVTLGAAEFYTSDAIVQQQVKKLIHSMVGNK